MLLRPVNKRDAHAAAAEITDIRRFRKSIYGTPATDHLTLDLDIELLRAEAGWILNDRRRFW